MAEPEWPTRGAGGVDVWQGATRMGHADAREGRHMARLVSGGPTGIVGPGNMGDGHAMVMQGSSPI